MLISVCGPGSAAAPWCWIQPAAGRTLSRRVEAPLEFRLNCRAFRELWSEQLGGRWCIDPYVSRWRELMLPKG